MPGTGQTRAATSDTHEAGRLDAGAAGVALGLVLLSSFVLAGRGFGASGAFAAVAGAALDAAGAGPATPGLAERLPVDVPLWESWIVWQVAGMLLGAAVSARLARTGVRAGIAAEQVVPVPVVPVRVVRTLVGGALMGMGARFAYGCTSGLALSGGALMATGAWVFIGAAFTAALLVAWLMRRVSPVS